MMNNRYALDTNILVRYITQDDAKQSEAANRLIEGLTAETPGFISVIVLCEVNWVLRSCYKISKQECAEILQKITLCDVFDLEKPECCNQALKAWRQGEADFSDYLIQAIAKREGYSFIVTFDKKALKEPGFVTPDQIVST